MKPIEVEFLLKSNVEKVTRSDADHCRNLVDILKNVNEKLSKKVSAQSLEELIKSCEKAIEKLKKLEHRERAVIEYGRTLENIKLQKIILDKNNFENDYDWAEAYHKQTEKWKKQEQLLKYFPRAESETWEMANQKDISALKRANDYLEWSLMPKGIEKEIEKIERSYLNSLRRIKIEKDRYKLNSFNVLNPDEESEFKRAEILVEEKRQRDLEKIINREKERQESYIKELLGKYEDFEAQRKRIKAEGEADIAKLRAARNSENTAEIDRAIGVAKARMEKGLREIADAEGAEAARGSEFMRRLFGDYARMSLQELSGLIGQARKLREYLSGGEGDKSGITFISAEQLEAIEESPAELEKLKKALDRLLDPGGKQEDKWSRIFGTMRKGLAGLREGKGPEDTAASISEIAGAATEAGNEIAGMLEAMGNRSAADAVRTATELTGAIGNIGKGFAAGGLVGGATAALGELTGMIANAFGAQARHREALKEIERQQTEFRREYNLLLMEQKLAMEDAGNVFGEREVMKAAGAIEVYRKAVADLRAEMAGERPEMNPLERLSGDITGSYARRMAEYERGVAALAEARIVTGHKKTGLFGWGKGKDTYSGLLEVYPELIKANGDLDTEMLRVILDTRKMSDETRAYLENLVELQGVMDEAEASLESYLQETFGTLGEGMMDAVTAAVRGSEGALESFAGHAAGTLETLGEQIAYSLFFADRFDELQRELKEAYGSGGSEEKTAESAMALLGDFYAGIGRNMEEAQGWLEEWKAKASEMGFDLWESEGSGQSGRAGAFTAISQDQGTKLEGLFTSVQMHEASIDENVEDVAEGLQTAVGHLRGIEENTGATSEKLDTVVELLEKFDREGIKV